MNEPRFWIVVASLDHVELSVAGCFVEVNHGKAGPLERMRGGDGIACYSPRRTYPDGAPLQAFTALGRVAAAPIVQSPLEHQPFRRAVEWLPSTHAPVRPLLDALGFVANRAHWGAAFRFGFLRIGAEDFLRISAAMACPFEVVPPVAGAEPGAPSPSGRRRAVRPLPAEAST
jgi:hypothetical protein